MTPEKRLETALLGHTADDPRVSGLVSSHSSFGPVGTPLDLRSTLGASHRRLGQGPGNGHVEASRGTPLVLRYDFGPRASPSFGAGAGEGKGGEGGEDLAWRQAVEEAARHMRKANPNMPVSYSDSLS